LARKTSWANLQQVEDKDDANVIANFGASDDANVIANVGASDGSAKTRVVSACRQTIKKNNPC